MLFLIDKPMAEIGFRTAKAAADPEIVLLQDGVFLDPGKWLDTAGVPVYAVERDLSVRGVTPPEGVDPIPYDELVDLVFEQEVKSFV